MSLIIPSVYAELTREKYEGRVKFATLAKVCGYLNGTTEGDTVTFPKWEHIGDATDKTKGTAFGSTSLAQTTQTAKIKMVAPDGVQVYDSDNKTALGDAINEGATQQGIAIARKVDTDIATLALTTVLKNGIAGANAITETELIATFQLFGDEQDNDSFAGIVINSKMLPSFYAMDGFVSDTKTYTVDNNGVVINGVVGFYRGTIPVILTDKGTYDSTKLESILFIVKKDALGIIPKEEITVEEKREAEYRRSTVFSSQMYAVALLDDEGVAVARKTIV